MRLKCRKSLNLVEMENAQNLFSSDHFVKDKTVKRASKPSLSLNFTNKKMKKHFSIFSVLLANFPLSELDYLSAVFHMYSSLFRKVFS